MTVQGPSNHWISALPSEEGEEQRLTAFSYRHRHSTLAWGGQDEAEGMATSVGFSIRSRSPQRVQAWRLVVLRSRGGAVRAG